jgi:PAS domain S-box-containing protein
MSDTSKKQLIAENEELLRRVKELEAAVAGKEQTGEALREREARLHEAQEVASLGFYVLDIPHGRWTSSPVLDQILGIPPDYTKTVEGWGDLVHPDDRQAMLHHLSREVIEQGQPCNREYRIVRWGDKQVRWVHGLGRLQFNEKGRPIVMLGTVQDITDRKRAEEALRQSETRFRSLYRDSVIGKAVVAPNGEVIQANPAFCEFLGYSEQELIGKTVHSITYPEDRDKTAEVIRQALTSGPRIERFEKRYLHKNGQVLWAEVSTSLICDAAGKPSYFIAQVLDIGKRKRAEEALKKAHDELERRVEQRTAELTKANEELKREVEERRRAEETLWRSEERFRVAFEEAPVGMIIAVGDGIITRVNHAMSRISGHAQEELTGRNMCELIYPEDREPSLPLIEKLLAGKLPIVTLESRYLGKSGRVFWARTTTTAVYAPNGEMVFALGIIEDITERKRAEEALRQSEERLRLAQQVAQVGTFEWNVQTGLSFWTPELEAMYGLPPGGFPGTHSAWEHLVHCDDRAEAIRQGEQAFESGEPLEAEWRVVWPDGSVHRLLGRMQTFKDESGKPLRMIGVNIDITERKRVERRLAYLASFPEGNPNPVVEVSLGGEVQYMNPAAHCLFPELHEQGLSHPWLENWEVVVRPFCEGSTENIFRSVTVADRTYQQSFQYLAQEQVVRIFGLDVTDLEHAQKSLRQSHDELRAIYDSLGDGLLVADRETLRLVRANAAICSMLSYSEEELLSMSIANLHPQEALPAITEVLREENGEHLPNQNNVPMLRKDGSVFYADITGDTFTYQGRPCSLGVFRDVTERKQAQEAIKESEAKLKTLFQILPVGIALLDEHRHIVDLNPALEQIQGMTKAGLLRGDYARRQYVRSDGSSMPPEEYPSVLAMKTGTVISDVEVGVVREDGTTIWVSVSAAPLPVRGLGAAVATMDVTERKHTQVALERERRTLEHMLRASDHERQLIAYDIHDGLAQYLTGAIMQLQMSDHLRDETPEEAAKAFAAGTSMVRESLAEARRLISGVRPPILDESGVVAAVAHLVYDFRAHKGPKVEFHSEVDFDRLAPTLENAVYRIAQEGLTNAWKYSKSKKVSVGLVQLGEDLRIEIQDWGVGFDLNSVEEGRFGLEGIRERTRLLGGKSVIESTPGKGTRIVVDLPIVLRKENGE